MPQQTNTVPVDVVQRLRAEIRRRSLALAKLSHRIQSELNDALSMAHLLASTQLEPQQAEAVDGIRRVCEGLLPAIAAVSDFSEPEPSAEVIADEEFELHTAVRAAVANLAFAANAKNVALNCLVHRDVPRRVAGDGPRLRQVLADIVKNVIACSDAGKVTVHVAVDETRANACVVRFFVSDTADTIVSWEREGLFEFLEREDAVADLGRPLAGLGLAVCRDLVTLMGGQVGVAADSERGMALWFTVTLRVPGEKPVSKATRPMLAPHHPILLVCNDPETIPQVLIALQQQGFAVELEEDRRQFPLRLRDKNYSLVLVDGEAASHMATFAAWRSVGQTRKVPVLGLPRDSRQRNRLDTNALLGLVQKWVTRKPKA